MATKRGRKITYLNGLLPITSHDPLITWSCITWQTKTIISSLPQYLWPLNLAGLWLIMREFYPWSCTNLRSSGFCKITWQTKTIISPPIRCIWPPSLVEVWLIIRGFHPWTCTTLRSSGFAKSRDKLKALYIHYQNAYGYKTWHNCDLQWTASTYKVTWPYYHRALRDHMAIKIIIYPLPQCLWLSKLAGWG